MKEHKLKKGRSDEKMFDAVVNALALLILIIVLYPLIFIVSASFSDPALVLNGEVYLLPKQITFEAYKNVFENKEIWNGYVNTIVYTAVGTAMNLIMTTLAAYPLSRPDLPGRGGIMFFVTLTMFFSGGLIPSYLIVKSLGMVDTMWALIIPGAIATYNLIVMRTYFKPAFPGSFRRRLISTAAPTGSC